MFTCSSSYCLDGIWLLAEIRVLYGWCVPRSCRTNITLTMPQTMLSAESVNEDDIPNLGPDLSTQETVHATSNLPVDGDS